MGSEVYWSAIKWSELKIFGDMWVLSLIYSYVAVYILCAVCCVIIICLSFLFSNYSTHIFNIIFMFVFSFCVFVFYVCILCFCIALCVISPYGYRCLSIIFVQVYWPLPPGGILIAVNIYHIKSYQQRYIWRTLQFPSRSVVELLLERIKDKLDLSGALFVHSGPRNLNESVCLGAQKCCDSFT
jgi:hypothetical protein